MPEENYFDRHYNRIKNGLAAMAAGPTPIPAQPANIIAARYAAVDVPPGVQDWAAGPLANVPLAPKRPTVSLMDRMRNMFRPADPATGLEKQLNVLEARSTMLTSVQAPAYNRPAPAAPAPVKSPPASQIPTTPALTPIEFRNYQASIGGGKK